MEHCSICHGAGGKGFIGPYVAGINWTAPGLIAIVRKGIGGYGGMPAFNVVAVSDQNISNVAAYLASLPAAVASKSTTSSPKVAAPIATSKGGLEETPAQATAVGVGDPVHGKQIYAANCSACHGASGQGGVGPTLHGEKSRKGTGAAIAWIKNPVAPMPKLYPSVLNEKDVADVAAYVESL